MTEQSEHLSSAQIENYGNRTSGAGPEAAQRDEPQRLDHQSSDDQSMNDQRVEAHLADCPSCRNRVLDFHRHRFALLSGPAPDARPTDSALADSKFANPKYPAGPLVRTAATPECPSDDALRQLAAGLTPEDVSAKLTQHAATCNHCGPLLRTYTEIFSDDFTPEEQTALADLQSGSAEWQKNTVRKMLRASSTSLFRDSPLRFMRRATWKWALAPAFLLVLVAGVGWVYPLLILHKASLAVEAEYRKGRPMEYRVAGVPYGPYEGELGGRGIAPIIEIPNPERAPLLAANAALLHDDYTSAKSILENALRRERSLSMLNNLAVAYAMEADHIQSTNEEDKKEQQKIYLLGLAITEEVLHQNSSDAAALFNRALILDRVGRGSETPALLKQLKQVEQDTGWRQEAEEKLQLMR